MFGSGRAVRVAAAVTVTAMLPFLLASDCDDGWESERSGVSEARRGHAGPAWGRIDGEDVIVFRWDEGFRQYGGSLYTVRADGTDLRLLSPAVGDGRWLDRKGLGALAYDTSPVVSPGGRRVAYATLRHSEVSHRFDVVVATLDGKERRQVTQGLESQTEPSWSPDGTRIAYLQAGLVHSMAADGSGIRSLAPETLAVNEPPAWSPDGKRLAFRARDEGLYTVGLDGSNLVRVAEGVLRRPVWSPDGLRIAFLQGGAEFASGEGVLSMLDLETGTIGRLVGGAFGPLLWSPDVAEIYGLQAYSIDEDPGLFAVTVEGEPRIRRVANPLNDVQGLAWSPEGTRLAVRLEPFSRCANLDACPYADVVLYTVAPDGSDLRVLLRAGRDGELVAEGEAAR